MSAAVIIQMGIREYDSRVSQNINNSKRSTMFILYITNY